MFTCQKISSKEKIDELENELSKHKISSADKAFENIEQEGDVKEKLENISISEHIAIVKGLQEENDSIGAKNKDLEDEILLKVQEIHALNEQIDKSLMEKDLTSSASSLADELASAQKECDPCGNDTQTRQGLDSHIRRKHEISSEKRILEETLKEMTSKIYEQKFKLTSSLLKLREKENLEKQTCKCKNYCRIYHYKHNWRRSISDVIISKM